MKRLDSHQHFWRLSRGDYGWLSGNDAALAPIRRDVEPAELKPVLAANGVSRTVLVQAAPSVAETEFLLDIAKANAFVAGVVGWVDLSEASSAATLERLAASGTLKSVRPVLQDIADINWIVEAPDPVAMRMLKRLDLRFDALVKPQHLEALITFARRHPSLPIIIDHAAKPQLAQGWEAMWVELWEEGMAVLARHGNVCVKFSGLMTELDPGQMEDPDEFIGPVWDRLVEWFGPGRILWGSDWPVLTLAGRYEDWITLSQRFIGQLTADEQQAVWHDNAVRIYGLEATA